MLRLIFFVGQCRFYHNRAFHALFLKLTAKLVDVVDLSVTIVGIGSTAAAAVKFCKTASALFFGVNITAFEFVHDVRTHRAPTTTPG